MCLCVFSACVQLLRLVLLINERSNVSESIRIQSTPFQLTFFDRSLLSIGSRTYWVQVNTSSTAANPAFLIYYHLALQVVGVSFHSDSIFYCHLFEWCFIKH